MIEITKTLSHIEGILWLILIVIILIHINLVFKD